MKMLEIYALNSIFRAVVNAEVHTHSDGCTNICLKEGLHDLPDDIHCRDSSSCSDDDSQLAKS